MQVGLSINQSINQSNCVECVSGSDLPVVEDRQTERLSLSVSAQICLKSKRVNRRHERLDYVERRTRHRCILGNVTPTQYIDN